MTTTRVGNVLVAPGDGDTDGGMIYIQSTECQDWIAFQVEHAGGVIAAIRKAQQRILEGAGTVTERYSR